MSGIRLVVDSISMVSYFEGWQRPELLASDYFLGALKVPSLSALNAPPSLIWRCISLENDEALQYPRSADSACKIFC